MDDQLTWMPRLAIFIFQLIPLIGFSLLQYFLSNKDHKWLGYILPILSFFNAGLKVFLWALPPVSIPLPHAIHRVLSSLFFHNIPTLVFLCIYWLCRRRIKKRAQIEKMNIQDLE